MLFRFISVASVLLFCSFAGLGGCGEDSPTAPISPDSVRLTIKNELVLWDITHVYVSPIDSDQWGNDLLGQRRISPGKSVVFGVPKGRYDLRAVDTDNDSYYEEDVMLNRDYTWEVEISDLVFADLFE